MVGGSNRRDQAAEVQKVMESLRGFSADVLTFLHYVCGHLNFWRERNEVLPLSPDLAWYSMELHGPECQEKKTLRLPLTNWL